jgi:2-oxoglutarate dehydrogenase E2 component (dihydrolipoamide succinyltransferase)
MSVSVTMPQLGESVTEGTVTRWLKQVGDTVTADEPLLEISTDKVDTEIPSPVTGVLLEIRVLEDGIVQVGAELAVIGAADEVAPAAQAQPAAPVVAATPEPVAAPVAEVAAPVAAPAATQSGSTVDVTLPQLGESVSEGTVTRWLKQVGETVTADEPLVEISTDKVDTELPAPVSGVLLSIIVAEDSTTEVGSILGVIGVGASAAPVAAPIVAAPVAVVAPVVVAPVVSVPAVSVPAAVAPVVSVPAAAPIAAPAAPAPTLTAPRTNDDDSYVTPLVRRLAVQNGIDLSTVIGTGVGGRIRKQDVAAAAEAKAAAVTPAATPATQTQTAPAAPVAVSPLRGRTEPLSRLRKVIAERMVESLQISAQLTSVVEVDVTRIANLRNKVKGSFEAREGVKLTFLPFIGKAAVETLKQFPMVNASIDMAASTITYHDTENLGIAVDTDRGLLVPVIRNAGDLNIAGLSRSISDIAERTRSSKVLPDELSGGTFTITNTGSRGSLFDTPIVNQPQVAILGTGAIEKRPVVVPDSTGQDVIAIRSMMYLALSYDHRVVDGADAARFLVAMKNRLEEGSFEAELGL